MVSQVRGSTKAQVFVAITTDILAPSFFEFRNIINSLVGSDALGNPDLAPIIDRYLFLGLAAL